MLALSVCLVACHRNNPEDLAVSAPPPPPSAALVRLAGATTLDHSLDLMQRELTAALASPDKRNDRLIRAEAISDRLLENQLPFAWLRASSYGVESRVRQIQAMADRIMAETRSGLSSPVVLADVRALQQQIMQLRAGLRAGGSGSPPTLEQLLAAYAGDTLAGVGDKGE